MKIEYRLEIDELMDFFWASVKQSANVSKPFVLSVLLVWVVAGCAWLLQAMNWIRPGETPVGFSIWFSIIALLAALVYTFVAVKPGALTYTLGYKTVRKLYEQDMVGDYMVELTEACLTVATPKMTTDYQWSAVTEVMDFPTGLALCLGENQAIVVPSSAFESDAEAQRFVEQVQRNLHRAEQRGGIKVS